MKTTLAALLLTLLASSAQADSNITGNDYVASCASKNATEKLACITYTRGVTDGVIAWSVLDPENAQICVPSEAITNQVVDLTRAFIRNNPQARHKEAGWLIIAALAEAWPCKEGKQS